MADLGLKIVNIASKDNILNSIAFIKRFLQILGRAIVALLLIFLLAGIVFSIPAVQTFVAKRLTATINEQNNVDISIGRIQVTYFGNVELDEVLINDHRQDTLIYAQEIRTSILSITHLLDVTPRLGSTIIEGLRMDMKIYQGDERDNLYMFADSFKKNPDRERTPFQLAAGDVEIINSKFSYLDLNAEDPTVVSIDNLNILGSDLFINGPEVSLNIHNLTGLESRGLEVDFLNADFMYTPTSLELLDFELHTPESEVIGNLVFDTRNGYGDFVNQVEITANFEETSVSSNDLQAFYQEFGDNQLLEFSTTFQGVMNDFRLNDLRFKGMDRSTIYADVIIQNIFAKQDEVFSLVGQFEELSTNYYDLVNLLPNILGSKLPQQLTELGHVRAQGFAVVTNNSVDTDMHLSSQLGTADVDIMLDNLDVGENATYRGNISVQDFNIGLLTELSILGLASFSVDLSGSGFTTESLNTELNGTISRLGFNGYTYRDIKLLGTLNAPVFNGDLISLDPNLQLEFSGLVDFSKDTNIYDFEAGVDYANLAALNFMPRDTTSVFKGDVIMNMRGTNLNDAAGVILLLNTSYQNQNDLYSFEDLRVTSNFADSVRTIQVNSSDVISGTVEGIFDINQVPSLIQNSVGSIYTNYQPNKLTNNQYLEFDLDIYNKIVDVFFPDITLAPNTFIRGRMESDESEFRLNFRSPEISVFENKLLDVNVQVDNTNPLFNTYIEIDSISTGLYNFSEFNLINVTLNDTLYVRSELRGGAQNKDTYNLNLYHTINEDNNSVVGVQKSDILFKGNQWFLNEFNDLSNRVVFEDRFNDIRIDTLRLSHEKELIQLAGNLQDSTHKTLRMRFDDVDLGKISPESDNLIFGGVINGDLNLWQREQAYYPHSSLTVADLELNDTVMGDLHIDILGNSDLSIYNVNMNLNNQGRESFSGIGEIAIDDGVPQILLDVNFNDFGITPLSGLGKDVLDNMRGQLSGHAIVSGDYRNPDINGGLTLQNAGLRIPYLNVDLDFEPTAEVELEGQRFILPGIEVNDTEFDTKGLLSGSISHTYFSDWVLDLNLTTDRLLVLNTEKDEEALYYGQAFISGTSSITGPTDQLVINTYATTEPGTVFRIPIDGSETIGDNSFIHFLSPLDKAARLAGEEFEFREVKGLELNFDLDVTNNAQVEIEMDGSVLRGQGAGTLLIEINTLGKFNMWGDFITNSGEYIFNYGALQKRFEVRPGGTINWSGHPAEADVDIFAVYEASANPALILENPSVGRNIPVDVVINLKGELLHPDFSFDLEYPNATSVVRSELEYKISNSANTEMQAFSLLALGQFYTENVFNAGTAWAGNLFESASGFFNSILADEDGVFQVGLNYEQGARTPDETYADRFGVTLSTQISDRVLINGKVGVPIGGVTETVVVGNIEIEFLLNEEGNLRAKVFNRENNIQYFGEELGFTQGVGLTYQVDFDTFKELIQKLVATEVTSPELPEDQDQSSQEDTQKESLAPDYITFPGTNGNGS